MASPAADHAPSPAPALRLVQCEECGRLRAALDAAVADVEAAQAEARSLRRQLAVARAEQASKRRDHPNYEVAEKLFEYWREQCGHPQAKFGPKREQAIMARLGGGFTAREIATAIKGAAVGAYVDERGVKWDDLELICRNEVQVEKFIDRYHRHKQREAG